jgi:WD40 repeat protein
MRYFYVLMIFWIGTLSVQADEPITPQNADQVVELQRIGNGYRPQITISPNEQTISVTSSIGVWLYDANNLTIEPRFLPFVRGYGYVRFSADSSQLLAVLSDSSMRVWDVETGAVQFDLFGHRDNLYQAKFSPDGHYIVSTGLDNARIWDAQTGEMLHFLEMGIAHPANFSPDGQRVVIGGGDGIARVWDVVTGELLLSLVGHQDLISISTYSPDGKTILTASNDGDVRLWDAETGLLQHTLIGNQAIANAFYTADGDKIISVAGEKVWVWDVQTALLIFVGSHLDHVHSEILNHDETELITRDRNHTIYRWDMKTGELIEAIDGERIHYVLEDSNNFAIGQVYTVTDETITILNIYTNQTLSLPNIYHAVANRMVYNPETDWMLTLMGIDKDVYLWDAKTWDVLDIFSAENGGGAFGLFLPDNKRLIIGAQFGTLTVWNIETHEKMRTSEQRYAAISVEISADGQHLFSNNVSENFVWNFETGEEHPNMEQFLEAERANQPTTEPNQINGLIIDTNYAWYYSHGVVELWDAQTGELLNTLEGHTEGPPQVFLSQDKTRLFTTSNDGTIRIWGIPE